MQTIGENSELAGAIRGRGMYDVGTAAFTRYSLASGKELVSLGAEEAPASPSPPAPAGVATVEVEGGEESNGKAASGSFAASGPAGSPGSSKKKSDKELQFEVPVVKAPEEKKEKEKGKDSTPPPTPKATPAPPAPAPKAAPPSPPPAPAPTTPPPPTRKPIKYVDLGLVLSGTSGGEAAANFTAEREQEVKEALSAALGIGTNVFLLFSLFFSFLELSSR